MEEVRSFIAIELPEALRKELAELQSRLKAQSRFYVKWVNPSGIHLTLKFLGYVPAERLDEITLAMEAAASEVPPFSLQPDSLGAFPNLSRVQVVWVGLTGDIEPLGKLAREIEREVATLGYPPEGRPFAAHLTLARMGNQATPEERRHMGDIINRTRFESSSTIAVSEVSLMRSQLTRQGAIYTRIGAVRLGKC